MMLKTFIAVLFASSALCAGELFVDFNKGKNSQPGTRQAPFKTLNQALRKYNQYFRTFQLSYLL